MLRLVRAAEPRVAIERRVRSILDLEASPWPRGYDKVEGQDEIYRMWVGRNGRVLYTIDAGRGELIIEAVRRRDEGNYRR